MSNTIYTENEKIQPNPLVPVSFVRDIHDNGSQGWTLDINHEIPWVEFGKWLVLCFKQEFKTKADAPLFSPTVYKGTRSAANGTTSRMLVLDSDGGLPIEKMLKWLQDNEIESVLYSSARHKSTSTEIGFLDKFRVVILLDETVDTQTQGKASRALARLLSEQFDIPMGKGDRQWDLDPSRLNGHTLFYVPGQYAQAGENIFEHIEGDPLNPHALIELYPEAEKPAPQEKLSARDHEISDTFGDDDPGLLEQRAEAAIKVIPNNFADRGTWIKIGMALKAAFINNDGHGYSLWAAFSRGYPGNSDYVIDKEWRSFNPHQVQVNTLFWFADQADPSWRDQFRQSEPWKNIKGVMSLQDMIDDWKADPPADNDNEKTETVTTKPGRKRFYSSAECAQIPPPNWLVKNLIPENADTAIYGPSGTLKSFVALDLAMSIATALQAFGTLEITTQMPVIYFAGEGFHNMAKKRQVAWQIHRGLPPYGVENFWFADGTPLTNDDHSIEADIVAMKEILNGQRLGLIVIDTLSRALNGLNENEAHSASTYFAKLKRIRDEFGGTSLTVGHFGKDLERGERGSSNFRACYDTVIWIEKHSKDEDSGTHTIQLFVVKQKDADDGMRIWLQSQRIPLPVDGGDPEPCSLVLVPITEFDGRTVLASDSEKQKKVNQESWEQEVGNALAVLLPGGGNISTMKLVKYFVEKEAGPNATQDDIDTLTERFKKKLQRGRKEGTLKKYAFKDGSWARPWTDSVESFADMMAEAKAHSVPNGQFIQED